MNVWYNYLKICIYSRSLNCINSVSSWVIFIESYKSLNTCKVTQFSVNCNVTMLIKTIYLFIYLMSYIVILKSFQTISSIDYDINKRVNIYQDKYLNFQDFKNVALSSLKCKFYCMQVYKVIYI